MPSKLEASFPTTLRFIAPRRAMLASLLAIFCSIFGGCNRFSKSDPRAMSTVTVIVESPAASPQRLEREVAVPLEVALAGMPGCFDMRTYCVPGRVMLTSYSVGDLMAARQEIAARLQSVNIDSEKCTIRIQPLPADFLPIVCVVLTSNQLSMPELGRMAEQSMPRLMRVPNVREVEVFGYCPEEIQVQLDGRKLTALGLEPNQVKDEFTSSLTSDLDVEKRFGSITSPEDFNNYVVAAKDGIPIRVKDIASIQSCTPRQPCAASFQDRPCVVLAVFSSDVPEITRLVDNIKSALDEWQPSLPPGLKVEMIDHSPGSRTGADTIVVDLLSLSVLQLESRDKTLRQAARRLHEIPGIESILALDWDRPADMPCMRLLLRCNSQATGQTTAALLSSVRNRLQALPGMQSRTIALSSLPYPPRLHWPIHLMLAGDRDKLATWSHTVADRLRSEPGIADVFVPSHQMISQTNFAIDQTRATEKHVPIERLNGLLEMVQPGVKIGTIGVWPNATDIRMIFMTDGQLQTTLPKDLSIRNSTGESVPLDELVKLSIVDSLAVISRNYGSPTVEITCCLSVDGPAVSLSKCIAIAEQVRAEMQLPANMFVKSFGSR